VKINDRPDFQLRPIRVRIEQDCLVMPSSPLEAVFVVAPIVFKIVTLLGEAHHDSLPNLLSWDALSIPPSLLASTTTDGPFRRRRFPRRQNVNG
jgi:hypothetical protein